MKTGPALLALLLLSSRPALPATGASPDPFPIPPGFKPRIEFWVDVFTRYSSEQVLIHDRRQPWVVYEVVQLDRPFDPQRRDQKSLIRQAQRRSPAGEEARFQAGLRERFAEGIRRSGAYLDEMRAIFAARGLPADLAYLPHVESSFQNDAHSSAACIGIWQWSRGTGRYYLRIDRGVDERRDPMAATHAAARHLSDNLDALGSWPLALTAYNHGVAGMRRARDRFGEDRFDLVVDHYRSRSFGFASKNFYAEFLAARRVALDPERYFGTIELDPPARFDSIPLPAYLAVEAIEEHLGLRAELLRALNPALSEDFYRGRARAAPGYLLRVPPGYGASLRAACAAIPAQQRHASQIPQRYHTVRGGESLSSIAARYGTDVRRLSELNGIGNPNRIFRGQRLRIR